MKYSLAATVCFLAIVTFLSSTADASIISDGEFNNPWGGSYSTYGTGSSFGGWTVTSGSVDLIGSLLQSPVAGGGSVDMDGSSPGAISQTFSIPSGWYELSFSLSGNYPGSGNYPSNNPIKTLDVNVGGSDEIFTYDTSKEKNTATSMNYITESLAFYVDGGSTTLTFTSLDASNSVWGPVIGNVSVSPVPVPAPATLSLLGTAMVGLGGLRLMKRRKNA